MYAEERMLFLRAEKDYRLENLTMEVVVAGENGKAGHFSSHHCGNYTENRELLCIKRKQVPPRKQKRLA